MTTGAIERSHGKARLTGPRLSDVNDGTAPDRLRGRDARGRAAHGNDLASGRGWKRALDATLPAHPDARRLYNGAVRQLVHDTPFARGECVRWVRHMLREAELDAAARAAGLSTELGLRLLALADKESGKVQRAATGVLAYTKRPTPRAKLRDEGGKLGELRAKVGGGET